MGGSHHDPASPMTCGEQHQELVMGLSHRPASLIPSVPLPTSVRPETLAGLTSRPSAVG